MRISDWSSDVCSSDLNSQFSQELRLSFDAWDGRLKGQTGVYFLKENNDRIEGQIQDFPTPASSGTGIYPQSVDARSFAIFGQVDVEIVPSLTATVGARMTWERKSGRRSEEHTFELQSLMR